MRTFSSRITSSFCVIAGTWVLGCHPAAAPRTPPAPAILVPRGCERSFAGRWVHAEDPRFRYEAEDDGLTLRLLRTAPEAMKRATPDGGAAAPPPPTTLIVLERTPQGFAGEVRGRVSLPERTCETTFPAEVVACSPDELRIRSTPTRSLDTSCQIAPAPAAPGVEQRLLRDRSAPDAGRPAR